jgi:hypothetical protein
VWTAKYGGNNCTGANGHKHEDSVETGLFGGLSSVDLERPFVLGFTDLA